jgi:hypothetical protein
LSCVAVIGADEKLNPEWDEAKVLLYIKWLRA